MGSKAVVLAINLLLVCSVFCQNSEINQQHHYLTQDVEFKLAGIDIQNLSCQAGDGINVTWQMCDAWSKIPSGLLMGNWVDMGNFDECYNIKDDNIYGKYCLGVLLPESIIPSQELAKQNSTRILGSNPTIGIHLAICIPSNATVTNIGGLLQIDENFCYSRDKEPQLSNGAIATIVILSVVGCLVVASTTFDIYLYYTQKETPHELLLAFSFLRNGRKIIKSSKNSDQLLCLNGIRAISMMWVIIGHEYSLALAAPLSNFFIVLDWMKDSANMYITGGTVSVDTFFTVGGLLTTYGFLRSMDKGSKLNIPMMYIHRYLRLTPAFAITILIYS